MSISLPDSVAILLRRATASRLRSRDTLFLNVPSSTTKGCYPGHEAIEALLAGAQRQYAYRAEPLTAVPDTVDVTIVARYVGSFPCSPADLRHGFRLSNDKMEFLEIH
jgi:hypothetical protein